MLVYTALRIFKMFAVYSPSMAEFLSKESGLFLCPAAFEVSREF